MKKIMLTITIMGVLLVALLTASCIELDYDKDKTPATVGDDKIDFKKVETFKEGFDIMQQIDKKHRADFKKEMLGGPLIKLENIGPFRTDLIKFLNAMDADQDTVISLKNKTGRTEADKVLLFIGARLEMLNAEEQFQWGYKYGNAGLVGDGFYCTEKEMILESTDHFEKAITHAASAQDYLDFILSGSEEIWSLIGANEDKPAFYNSPLQEMMKQIGTNRKIVAKNCPLGTEKTYITFDEGEANALTTQQTNDLE